MHQDGPRNMVRWKVHLPESIGDFGIVSMKASEVFEHSDGPLERNFLPFAIHRLGL